MSPKVKRRAHGLGNLGRRVLYWAPVWAPLALVFQLALGGLKPTLVDGKRVRAAADQIGARVQSLEAEREELEIRRTMLSDPIYGARVERSRKRAHAPLLSLDEARALAGSQESGLNAAQR